MDKYYCNYHKHTHYSNINVYDCVTKVDDYCKRAVELGHKEIFTTEHGFQGFLFDYINCAEKYGLNVISGAEVYYIEDRFEKVRKTNHLIIIALNSEGTKELNHIITKSYLDGYYYKPRVDKELLLSLKPENFVITTACIAGMWDDDDFIIMCKEKFKDHFFLEVQNHDDEKQIEVNRLLLEKSEKYNIPIIHANDSHYIYPKDSIYRQLFIKAKREGSNSDRNADDGDQQTREDNFILDYPSYDEIVKRYKKQGVLNDIQIKEALQNTCIFRGIDTTSHIDKNIKLPSIVKNGKEELKRLVLNAWKEESKSIPKELHKKYMNEIVNEMKTIFDTNMADYFVDDYYICKVAQEEFGGVLTRTGRGSAPSYIVNKLLKLTDLDRVSAPITLFPSRFMSTTRILETKSLPDIDLNTSNQKPFIKASKKLLGENNCEWMLAFKPLQDSSAFRLWCKSQGMDIDQYDAVAKDIDNYRNNDEWSKLIEDSKVFVGVIESVAPSPCSMLLYDKDVSREIGCITIRSKEKKSKDKTTMTCCLLDGYNCDKYKYLKNDYLAVQVYAIIADVCKLIGIDIPSIKELEELIDDKVWDIYEKGLTCTINQADSDFGTQYAMRFKPRSIADLSAFVAILRPGCASLRDDFVDRKPYTTGVEKLDELLVDGSARMIYQELIMKYLIWLGVEEAESYGIIKMIAKKKFKKNELDELKAKLLKGWIKQVGEEKGFKETWQIVEDASKYSFNSSHSLSMAYDSVYGAYLKSHYPLEYYSVVFGYYEDDEDRTMKLTNELKYFGISLKPIEFGKSLDVYMMDRETNSIYKGLKSVKFLNSQVSKELYELGKNEYFDFLGLLKDIKEKTSCNKRQLEILIKLNFFKKFGKNKYLYELYEIYRNVYNKSQFKKDELYKYDLTEYAMQKFAKKETKKLFKDIDHDALVRYMAMKLEDKSFDIKTQIQEEKENLGYIEYKNEAIDKNYFIVIDIKGSTYRPLITLRNINVGNEMKVKIKRGFKNNPVRQYSIVCVNKIAPEKKVAYLGKDENGKSIYKETEETEDILDDYSVISF